MKLPKPFPGARLCPLIRQGCVGELCSFWVEMIGIDKDGNAHNDAECSIPWMVTLGREQLVETARNSASYDKAATGAVELAIALKEVNPSLQESSDG